MLKYNLTEERNVQITDDRFQGLINEDLQEIIQALEDDGFEVRIVGGAVRDILLEEAPRDIDIATNALPEQVIFIVSELGKDIDSFKLEHGTVKVLINRVKYEITSLNYQMFKDNSGKLRTISGGTWLEDANRRDFTVNAMSMTLGGKIYDYLTGIDDLHNRLIRPIPDFDKKIKNDPVLILRFFKMLAKFQGVKYPKATLETVVDNLELVLQVSDKRTKKEIANIRKSPNAKKTLELMKDIGLMDLLKPKLKKSRTK